MKELWIITIACVQALLAQFNPTLPNGYSFTQNSPGNNFLASQRNNGVQINNGMNRLQVGNLPINQLPNVSPNMPVNLANNLPTNIPINLPNVYSNNVQNNLQIANRLPNLPVPNRLANFQQQNYPIANYGNFVQNVPLQNNYALNNLPNNIQLSNLPIGNFPIGNNYQINNLPVPNLPLNNNLPNNLNLLLNNYASANMPQSYNIGFSNIPGLNNLVLNNLANTNVRIPNNNQVSLLNNAQLYSNAQTNNLPYANNLISANYLQANPANNLQIGNVPVNFNLPNNYPINYNLANTNPNSVANVNNLQTNNLQLANMPITNNAQMNGLPVNNLYNFNAPNNLMTNIGQTLPTSLIQPNQNLLQNPNSVSFGNDCGCKANAMFLLDDNVANSLPTTPVVSLSGMQLSQLGKTPLFNGLPVIGLTESIVNLKPL